VEPGKRGRPLAISKKMQPTPLEKEEDKATWVPIANDIYSISLPRGRKRLPSNGQEWGLLASADRSKDDATRTKQPPFALLELPRNVPMTSNTNSSTRVRIIKNEHKIRSPARTTCRLVSSIPSIQGGHQEDGTTGWQLRSSTSLWAPTLLEPIRNRPTAWIYTHKKKEGENKK
jgi:hypothetical protein